MTLANATAMAACLNTFFMKNSSGEGKLTHSNPTKRSVN